MTQTTRQANELPTDLRLIAGVGDRDEHTACLLSAAAWLAGQPSSVGDMPPCVSVVVRPLALRLNDGHWWTDDAERTEILLPLAPLLVGTASTPEIEARRLRLVLHRSLCVWLPDVLVNVASAIDKSNPTRAAELRGHAKILRAFHIERLQLAVAALAARAARAARAALAALAASPKALMRSRREAREMLRQLILDMIAIREDSAEATTA